MARGAHTFLQQRRTGREKKTNSPLPISKLRSKHIGPLLGLLPQPNSTIFFSLFLFSRATLLAQLFNI
jgi:hypothetical protein